MTYLDSRDIRRRLWEASNARSTEGAYDNRELLSEILRLRRKKRNCSAMPIFRISCSKSEWPIPGPPPSIS